VELDTQLTKEQAAAWRLVGLGTAGAVSELPKFAAWLITVLGAVLTFLVSNHSETAPLIGASSLRISFVLFAVCTLAGLLAVWLTAPIKAGLALSSEVLQLRSQQLDAAAFTKSFASCLIFPYRCWFLCRVVSAQPTDALQAIRLPARLSQYQALLVLLQFLCAIIIMFVLAFSISI
jgi:hypothetical protein